MALNLFNFPADYALTRIYDKPCERAQAII